jgi:hypothetical protein
LRDLLHNSSQNPHNWSPRPRIILWSTLKCKSPWYGLRDPSLIGATFVNLACVTRRW